MQEKLVHKDNFIIANIWTSDKNEALPGVNVGHISLTTRHGHLSLWPGNTENNRHLSIPYKKAKQNKKQMPRFFSEPSLQFEEDYEQDCMRETFSESADYEFCLKGEYVLDLLDENTEISSNKIYLQLTPVYPFSEVSQDKEKICVEFLKEGLSYSLVTSEEKIKGILDWNLVRLISPELSSLTAPLNSEQLDILSTYYPHLINLMPEGHQKVTNQYYLQYIVKTPSGKIITDVIKETIYQSSVGNLVEALNEGIDKLRLQTFLPSILAITAQRGHTTKNNQAPVTTRKIYFELTEMGILQYTVITPSGKTITDTISHKDLCAIDKRLGAMQRPLNHLQLNLLQRFFLEILTITAQRKHTKELLIRPISKGMALRPGEVLYRFDTADNTYEAADDISSEHVFQYEFFAIKLIKAQFRVVLYSLDAQKIKIEMEKLKKPGAISGWTMQGSNLFTRTLGKTSESCASIAYRLLKATGFYSELKSHLSTQASSLATPDDLLRHVVAFKEKELNESPVTRSWSAMGVTISSYEKAIKAYESIGKNANAEEDSLPAVIPTLSRCTIQ